MFVHFSQIKSIQRLRPFDIKNNKQVEILHIYRDVSERSRTPQPRKKVSYIAPQTEWF